MGIFTQKTEEEKIREMFEKFGLDIENYNITKIRKKNVENIKKIAQDIAGNRFLKAGMALSMAPADKQATVGYLSAIFNQNWILIRQNELIIRLLEKISINKV